LNSRQHTRNGKNARTKNIKKINPAHTVNVRKRTYKPANKSF
jgi:hypothetical protein